MIDAHNRNSLILYSVIALLFSLSLAATYLHLLVNQNYVQFIDEAPPAEPLNKQLVL